MSQKQQKRLPVWTAARTQKSAHDFDQNVNRKSPMQVGATTLTLATSTVFADVKDAEGRSWAKQHGLAHIRKLGEAEAKYLLLYLKISPTDDMYSDALGDLVYCDNVWGWLEAYAKAGGDLTKLKVNPDFKASYKV